MNRLADAERQISIDFLWVKVGAEEVIPNREKHREIIVVVLRILAVVNVVIARSNDYPLQTSTAPPDVEMHDVIRDGIFQKKSPEHPPG